MSEECESDEDVKLSLPDVSFFSDFRAGLDSLSASV